MDIQHHNLSVLRSTALARLPFWAFSISISNSRRQLETETDTALCKLLHVLGKGGVARDAHLNPRKICQISNEMPFCSCFCFQDDNSLRRKSAIPTESCRCVKTAYRVEYVYSNSRGALAISHADALCQLLFLFESVHASSDREAPYRVYSAEQILPAAAT